MLEASLLFNCDKNFSYILKQVQSYRDQFVAQYIIYLNIWGALSKTIVFIVNISCMS